MAVRRAVIPALNLWNRKNIGNRLTDSKNIFGGIGTVLYGNFLCRVSRFAFAFRLHW
jgi:hypothetical protein